MNPTEPANEQGLLPDTAPQTARAEQPQPEPARVARPRGFAALDRENVRAMARKGGMAAHQAGTAHEFTSEEARAAGRKGGRSHAKRRGGGPDAPNT